MTTRSRIARQYAVTLVAVAALLAQAFFPHVHLRHVGSTRDAGVAAIDVDWCTAGCPATIRNAATTDHADADQHSSSTCPLCRAQSDARSSLLPVAFVVALPAAARIPLGDDAASTVMAVAQSVAAPRAPPFAS